MTNLPLQLQSERPPFVSAQQREQGDPHERTKPIPLLIVLLVIVLVLFGVAYIFFSEPFGASQWGDRRTVIDLEEKSTANAGGAAVGASAAANGKTVYTANCVACHQATGLGLPGVFPPLDGAEWVRGSEQVLINILLSGITGELEVGGAKFNGAMPAFQHLSDTEIAAVTSYIRGQWSNKAADILAESVAAVRTKNNRKTPFAGGAELKKLANP